MVEPALIAHVEFDDLTPEQVALLEGHPLTVRGPAKPNKALPIWVCGFQVAYPAEIHDVAQEVHVWAVRNQVPFRRLIADHD